MRDARAGQGRAAGAPLAASRLPGRTSLATMTTTPASTPPLDDPATDPFLVARAAADHIAQATGVDGHDMALVLGSGWGGAAELLGEVVAEVPTHEIPGFSAPAVAGHLSVTRSIRVERAHGPVRQALLPALPPPSDH